MNLTSSTFENNGRIPLRFTGEGENISPALEWSNMPSGCKGYALVCQDPDAPKGAGKENPFVHWLIYNISANISSLPEGLPQLQNLSLPVKAAQGKNSFGNIGYSGPLPPVGHGTHHYEFVLYALDSETTFIAGLRKDALLDLIQGQILDTAKIVGTYEREVMQKSA
jgi:Raf kinase inhibitor-like YbhB/YbcL family protein